MKGIYMNEITNVILRTIFIIIIIFILFKLMGKKQVSQMSMFDYITGITIKIIIIIKIVLRMTLVISFIYIPFITYCVLLIFTK